MAACSISFTCWLFDSGPAKSNRIRPRSAKQATRVQSGDNGKSAETIAGLNSVNPVGAAPALYLARLARRSGFEFWPGRQILGAMKHVPRSREPAGVSKPKKAGRAPLPPPTERRNPRSMNLDKMTI